jgi:hypothetical protein
LEAALNLSLLNEEKTKGSSVFLNNGGLQWLTKAIKFSFK